MSRFVMSKTPWERCPYPGLKAALEKTDYNQTTLAEATGISPTNVSRYVKGDVDVTVRAGVRRLLVDGARSCDARDPLRAREGLGGGENDDQRLEKRARREVLPLHDRQLPRRALPAVRAGPADESQKRHAGLGHAGRERMKKAADRWHRSTAMKKNTHERRFSSPPL